MSKNSSEDTPESRFPNDEAQALRSGRLMMKGKEQCERRELLRALDGTMVNISFSQKTTRRLLQGSQGLLQELLQKENLTEDEERIIGILKADSWE